MNHSSPSNQVPSVMTDPSLMTSDPSIRITKRNSKIIQILIVLLVVVSLVALVLTLFLTIKRTKENKHKAAQEEALANEVRHVNAQVMRDMDDAMPDAEDDMMFLNIFSDPPGAEVYLDGLYMGMTDGQNGFRREFHKKDVQAKLVIAMDGYYIVRKSFSMSNDYSERVALERMPVHAAIPVAPPPAPKPAENVMKNNAMIVGAPAAKTPGKKNKQTNLPNTDIVLPD